MKRYKFSLAALLLACSLPAGAVRAIDRFFNVTQPDGTTITIKRCGDEFSHFSITPDNILLAEEGDTFYYGSLDQAGRICSTGIPATDNPDRLGIHSARLTYVTPEMASAIHQANLENQLRRLSPQKAGVAQSGMGRFRTNFPTEGDIRSVVILVSYQDVGFNVEDPYGYFNGLLNTDGFDQYGATGCVAEYFRFNSNGLFRPEFTVLGPVTLPYPRSYYGANNTSGGDRNAYRMVVDAIQQLDPDVDFSQFDMDHDGVVDNVYVIYAGEGEASGGTASTVWPHSWGLSHAGVTLEADGVKIDGYGCSNEWIENRPDGMGTFTHEFSHVIGLPDLYSTNYGNSIYATPGAWSVMDDGPYLNNGHTPPNYSAYERLALGWIEPQMITGPDFITLENLADSNHACIISASNQTEYYLFENRQLTGWDKYLPDAGMLIWHVDYIKTAFESNQINNDRRHMCVELMKANNIIDSNYEGVAAGWCWPGSSGKTEFTDDTEPSMMTWTGERLNLPITEITHAEGLISFKVAEGRDPILAPEALEPEEKGEDWFIARWNPSLNATDYLLSVFEKRVIEPDNIVSNDMGAGTELSLPDGWSACATTVYTTSGNYGEAAPSYKMGTDNSTLSSPLFDKDISRISFWYKGINCDGSLEIAGRRADGSSVYIESLIPEKQGGHVKEIADLPEGVRQVIFTFKKNTGNIALDDVELTVSGSEIHPLSGYERKSTDGETEYKVTHPASDNTSYIYYVEATDGDFISRPSEKIAVSGQSTGGIAGAAIHQDFNLEGRTLYFADAAEVYNLTGQLLHSGSGPFTLPAAGVYLIRQNKKVTKLLIP